MKNKNLSLYEMSALYLMNLATSREDMNDEVNDHGRLMSAARLEEWAEEAEETLGRAFLVMHKSEDVVNRYLGIMDQINSIRGDARKVAIAASERMRNHA